MIADQFIRVEGAKEIAKPLQENTTLTTLSLFS